MNGISVLVLDWCKGNHRLCIFGICHLILLSIILIYISCFVFFGNNLLLAAYFILILDCGNDVRQKANSSDFLI